MANAAFADQHLDLFPSFSAVLRDRFGASVARLDFSDPNSITRVNAWVVRETDGAIPRLIADLEPDAALVLANAIHFRGPWSRPFDPALTRPLLFQSEPGTSVEVGMMHADEISARYREDESFQAISLPYGDGAFALVVVLPRVGITSSDSLHRLANDHSWLVESGFERLRGTLALPRVTLNREASILPALRALGLEPAFQIEGGFAGIAAPPPTLSRVAHRTMLLLDEHGTEASAATAAIMTTRSSAKTDEGFEMRVDRPFALFLRHEGSGTLLFAAWVVDPVGH